MNKTFKDEEKILFKSTSIKEGFEKQNKLLKILLFIFIIGSLIERTAVALTPSILYLKTGETLSKEFPVEDFCKSVLITLKDKRYDSLLIDKSIQSALESSLNSNPISFNSIESLVVSKEKSLCKIVLKDDLGLRGLVFNFAKDESPLNPFQYKLTDASEEIVNNDSKEE